MTDVSRGARTRRGGRGPGWLLLTSLLVLAILASSTLVFTNRVELLRLAVVLSLWAAVVAAFVTVIYRRQSELAQARTRDMKFVYDLQLDREISARREYELSVESHLRRTLSREIRAEAADELAGLRAELAALRSQLEVMLGTDLGHRPALETERIGVPMPAAPGRVPMPAAPGRVPMPAAPGRVPMPAAPGRVHSSRVTVVAEEMVAVAPVMESPIIDVPEEPLVDTAPAAAAPPEPPRYRGNHRRTAGVAGQPQPGPVESPAVTATPPYAPAPPRQPEAPWRPPEVRIGRHSTDGGQRPEPSAPPANPAPEPPRGRHWVPPEDQPVHPGRHRGPEDAEGEPVADEPRGQHADGQSFADLMARVQANPSPSGGGRRRRAD